ncbi:hypothetical protein CMI37_22440 [Candidatus Pacearchaeota archaeon]|nr:hypothetical protein [Candidatus Pacearchaeota archaeon]|tara:strand:+ start:1250 stop:1720 length:471 start_codon:yes stop_codon:yes gene_type:complete
MTETITRRKSRSAQERRFRSEVTQAKEILRKRLSTPTDYLRALDRLTNMGIGYQHPVWIALKEQYSKSIGDQGLIEGPAGEPYRQLDQRFQKILYRTRLLAEGRYQGETFLGEFNHINSSNPTNSTPNWRPSSNPSPEEPKKTGKKKKTKTLKSKC